MKKIELTLKALNQSAHVGRFWINELKNGDMELWREFKGHAFKIIDPCGERKFTAKLMMYVHGFEDGMIEYKHRSILGEIVRWIKRKRVFFYQCLDNKSKTIL